jgi:hypothetical protein
LITRDPEHETTTLGRDRDPEVDPFNPSRLRTIHPDPHRGSTGVSRNGAPKLIEVRPYMIQCRQARRP